MSPNDLNTEEDIETAFRSAVNCFPPPVGLKEAVAERLRQIDASGAAEQAKQTTRTNRNRSRAFLKIARWAVPSAAACAAAVLLVVSLLSGPGVVGSAYAEVARAIENSRTAEWVHATSFDGQMETWVSLKPYRVIQKSAGGGVSFDDADSFKSLRYDPEEKTIRIQDSMLEDRAREFDSLLGYVMSAINEDKDRGAVFERSQSTVNGKKCTVYTVSSTDKKRWKKLAVDAKVKQIVRFEILEQGQRAKYDFDYPSSGPEDIYAAGVPRDAKIVDVRTRDEQSNRMLDNAQKAKRQFENTFRAISCSGPLDKKTGKMVVDDIIVYYQTQHQRRIDWWHPKEQVDPNSTEDLEKYTRAHGPSTVDMTAPGGGGIFYNLTYPREVRKSVVTQGEPGRFQNILWKTTPWQYGKSLPDLEGDSGRLQGTQRVKPAGVSAGVVHALPTRWTIYLNPQRDYIAEKYEEWRGALDEPWVPRDGLDGKVEVAEHVGEPRKTTMTTLEYAKTPSGHWYARKQLVKGDLRGKKGTFMRVIHLDTTYKFPDGLFSPEAFERQLDRPVKSN